MVAPPLLQRRARSLIFCVFLTAAPTVSCAPAPAREPTRPVATASSIASVQAAASAALPAPTRAAQDRALGTAPPDDLWPAGTCGFDPYLGGACDDRGAPHFAVVLGEFARHQLPSRRFKRLSADPGQRAVRGLVADGPVRAVDDLARAERALSDAQKLHLPPGYPLVLSWDDMPAMDEGRRGLALVAGLFGERASAERWVRESKLKAEVVELAPAGAAQPMCEGDYEACMGSRVSAVEVFVPSKAYDTKALEALDAEQDQLPWIRLDLAVARYDQALAKLPPACEIEAGRVFVATNDKLYRFQRRHAPVRCKDGREAWVPWRATRLESIVTTGADGPELHQVVLVECDVPTIEDRPFLPTIPATLLAFGGGCRG